ncbi:MAG: HAD family hydrolase [Lachnospiraceae bacterium]|uniref:HAD family hydrolase n=1 Tax=Parablautia sp. Marseille-Q6255 TaxID=3039593 RepID=UPI0024BC796D|nr:HAD family phosphatase [Parablautia sp. Marseille-Q6255]
MLAHKKAVIFDLDGTLMDSMWVWKDIDIEYLGRYGYDVPDGLQKEIEGMSFTETAAYFKERFGIRDSLEEIKKEWNRMAYDKYAHEVLPKPGAAAFLKMLRQRGIRTAIASSNSRELILASLRSNGIVQDFDCILTACEVAKGKPAPDIYLSAARTLGVTPQETLVFEDVPMGILAGKAAGMKVCAVEDDDAKDQLAQIRSLADYYIRSYDDIQDQTYEELS